VNDYFHVNLGSIPMMWSIFGCNSQESLSYALSEHMKLIQMDDGLSWPSLRDGN
jgi:hypothetical protein